MIGSVTEAMGKTSPEGTRAGFSIGATWCRGRLDEGACLGMPTRDGAFLKPIVRAAPLLATCLGQFGS